MTLRGALRLLDWQGMPEPEVSPGRRPQVQGFCPKGSPGGPKWSLDLKDFKRPRSEDVHVPVALSC